MTSLLALVLFALTVLSPVSAGERGDAAIVVSIGDGDTLRVQKKGRSITVRLACTDAPEIAQSPWGQQAQQRLQALVPIGSAVALRSKVTDRYGRQVAEMSRGGNNVNQELVASSVAFVYWQ